MQRDKMRAVVYQGKQQSVLEERPRSLSSQDAGDAIVKVTLTTICSSDIHIKHGAVPRAVPGTVLGHEFVGVVTEIGSSVKKVKPGDRVAVNVETFCGECFFCRRGFVNNCENENGGWAMGCRIDGGQAEYCRIPFADPAQPGYPDRHDPDEDTFYRGHYRLLGCKTGGSETGGYGFGPWSRPDGTLYYDVCPFIQPCEDHCHRY